MPAVLLLILFIAVPIAELWLILQVGDAIGAGPTILLLIATSVLGVYLMRSQSRSVWRDFNAASAEGRVPAREAVNGVFVLIGGLFLMVPGFLSDFVGLLFLLPPTRKVFGNRALNAIQSRMSVRFTGGFSPADEGVRDFARSDQPRKPTSSTMGDREPEFDFEKRQIHE
jgi:UPF0716 protein FxsA